MLSLKEYLNFQISKYPFLHEFLVKVVIKHLIGSHGVATYCKNYRFVE